MSQLFDHYSLILGRAPVPEHLYARNENASLVNDKNKIKKHIDPASKNSPIRFSKDQKKQLRADITELLEMGVFQPKSIYNVLQKQGKIPAFSNNGKFISYSGFYEHVIACNKDAGNKYFANVKRSAGNG